MVSAHLPTNLGIGRSSGVIERPRLLDKLRLATEHKLTLINAPPGYGKTTLVNQFVRESPYPVVWHSVEERDRDIPILYARCLSVLGQVLPDIQSLPTGYGYPPAELAILIADYLRDNLPGDVIYVFDDVQHLALSPSAETWLRTFVTQVPSNCHLILLSRMLPDLPLTEMISRREVLAIGQEELRLTVPEIQLLAHEMLGSGLPSNNVEHLATRLEGWPAGTVLALYPLPAELERAMLGGGVGPEALFESLAAAMISALPLGLQDFLLASSTLARVTPELCSVALKLPNSFDLLTQALSRNVFLTRVSGGLVYHTLFRQFLQYRLKEGDPERFTRLHTQAGRWFEQNNNLDEAFEHYTTAGVVELAADISERVAQSYFAQGKVETLLSWSAVLKPTGVKTPRLTCACAKIHIERYEYEAAEAELYDAESGFLEGEDKPGIADVHIHQAILNLQRGEFQQADAQASHFLENWTEPGILRGRALAVVGAARLHLGEVEAAVTNLEEALTIFRTEGDAYTLSVLLQSLDLAYIRMGRFDEAAACLQEVVALRRSLGSAGLLALALNNLGYHYHQHGDYQQAMATFQEGLSVIARVPNRRAESYLLWSLGDLQRDRGALIEALQLYNKALELLGSSEPSLRCSLLVSSSVLHRWQGNLPDAISLASEAITLAETHHIALEGATAQAAFWTAQAQLGQAAESLNELQAIADNLKQQGTPIELVQVLGLCAQVAMLCSDKQLAEQYLESAARFALDMGSAQPLAAEILHGTTLESIIIAAPSRYEFLLRHLKLLRQAQYKPPVDSRPTPAAVLETYSLRVFTLGAENIERDGVRVPSSEWRATASRELFFYLLFMGPTSREQISLDFWPDSSSSKVRQNFHTTLYRARHALGENAIAFQDGLYLLNPDLDLWCDALELETLTQQTRFLSSRDARTEDLWRRAVGLYQGEFLISLEADWVIARREALREAYIDALVGLGDCARARNDFKEALYQYKTAIDLEPYREDIHRAVMKCYDRLGEKNRIFVHFHQLKERLHNDLAVEPSEETIALARALLT
jgi:LuxR family transcriptional regulator, maltose regulon positive regulatory protein